ncbi:MAG: nucleotidyltransferase domain-containing protein [Bacteroidales bacterium]|nr:nucleotidyltransferase domain-containing protein [Bacteroidales bacterium]
MTIQDLYDNNLFAYRYLRGSWAHGIGVEGKSDYDYGGVFICPKEMLYGVRSKYVKQISDEKNDETYYELGRWVELLMKSNPTVIESLFIDKKFVVGDIHPAIQKVIDNRDMFLTKECFNPLMGYVVSQSKKSVGYKKKCHIPADFERKDILDFCYTFKNQGSQPIKDFLKENCLDQRYIGLVNVPNMEGMYSVFYDFSAFFNFEKINWKHEFTNCANPPYDKFLNTNDVSRISGRIEKLEFFGYSGIVHPDEIEKTNEVRLSSVPKGEKPMCFMFFNKDGYASHCRFYKEWSDWKKNRNQTRYSDNKGYNFDAKNMCEMVRLLHTGIELVRDGVYNVERTWDRAYLLDIKNHKISYEEIMSHVYEKKLEFDELIKTSSLPDEIDKEKVNELLITIRKELY